MADDRGKDYIIRLIQYLDQRFGVRFFISPKEFDVAWRWFEKKIPPELVEACLERVVMSRREKKKTVDGFSCFYYEVRKSFDALKLMRVGAHESVEIAPSPTDPWETFFNAFPPELGFLREDFETHRLQGPEACPAKVIHDKLVDKFRGEPELEIKVDVFMNSLARELRQSRIENRYRLNYLIRRFHIPDLL